MSSSVTLASVLTTIPARIAVACFDRGWLGVGAKQLLARGGREQDRVVERASEERDTGVRAGHVGEDAAAKSKATRSRLARSVISS